MKVILDIGGQVYYLDDASVEDFKEEGIIVRHPSLPEGIKRMATADLNNEKNYSEEIAKIFYHNKILRIETDLFHTIRDLHAYPKIPKY